MNLISYRALKKLVGETSLERKCRFLFGLALLLLITTSFYLYALQTRKLVERQQVLAAEGLVGGLLALRHYELFLRGGRQPVSPEPVPEDRSVPEDPSAASAAAGVEAEPAERMPADGAAAGAADDGIVATVPQRSREADIRQLQQFQDAVNGLPAYAAAAKWQLIDVATENPDSEIGFEAIRQFRSPARKQDNFWRIRNDPSGSRQLLYYAAIRPAEQCLSCHERDMEQLRQLELESQPKDPTQPSSATDNSRQPLMAVVQIAMSLDNVESQLSQNRAVLLASGIVTSFLAMMAAYAIVRYIIVKPVLHLKDVSDEIARGNLNLRAEISTGDEFEELSHAFNRMLRHMMTVNDELRGLNLNLDGKVDELARANMELFNNNRLKDDFLATMSHELRTPLNSILGFSDILQTASNLDERQKRYVHNIQTSGQSLMVQINDLLDLAKIESGKMDVNPSEVNLAEIIDQQVQQIAPLADRRNIDLRVEHPAAPLPPAIQDRGKISQILSNLLSNALKFTPEGGRVRVGSRQRDADMVEISVEDTGIGIPLQEQEHIFEKFRQGSTAPGERDHVRREYEGTGLGLSIVRELSRLLGGDVSVESEFGKGSLFVVRLPLTAPRPGLEKVIPLESRSSPGLGRITSVDLLTPRRDGLPNAGTGSSVPAEPVAPGHAIPPQR